MTRSLAIIISIIVLGIGLHFYTQWDIKRFKASLPKPPIHDKVLADGTAEAENSIDNSEKIGLETGEGHWHENQEWHAAPNQPEPASDETREDSVQEEYSQLAVLPSEETEEIEPLEEQVLADLHAEVLELQELQRIVESDAEKLIAAAKTGSMSRSELIAEIKEINLRLQALHKQQHLWQSKYVEYNGTEYPGTEHWVKHHGVDKETLREQVVEDLKSRGYLLLPQGTKP